MLVGREGIILERAKDLKIDLDKRIKIANAAISQKNQDYIDYMYNNLAFL